MSDYITTHYTPDGKEYRGTYKQIAAALAADLADHPGETWPLHEFHHEVTAALRTRHRYPPPGIEPSPHLPRHLLNLILATDRHAGPDAVAAFMRDNPGEWQHEGARASLLLATKALGWRGNEDRFYLTLYAHPDAVNVSITRNFLAASEDGIRAYPDDIMRKIAEVAADKIVSSGDSYYNLTADDLPAWLRAPVKAVLQARAAALLAVAETVKDP